MDIRLVPWNRPLLRGKMEANHYTYQELRRGSNRILSEYKSNVYS